MKALHKASSLLLFTGLLAVQVPAAEAPAGVSQRLVRDGVAIEFEARPLGSDGVLTEGMFADVRLRISDATTGQPLAGQVPGAWLDQALPEGQADQCKVRIGTYLKGVLSARPLVDLNSYYLVVMNKDSALTVIDPVTSVGGITSTLTRVALKRPPMDWAASADDRLLYVSMPSAGEVAVVDTTEFKVLGNLPAGPEPVRVALQPDGRYLWVGNNAQRGEEGGVTVIDTQARKTVATLATGGGHHEIAFSADSRFAFVSSRDAGRVTVVDVASLKKVQDIETGPSPLSLALSNLSGALYVSDGKAGTVTVIDARSLKVRKVIDAGHGLGPLRFTPDGRFGLALNSLNDQVLVLDAGSDEIVQRAEITAEPYQLVFTRNYAYVRGLASPKVSMINLESLGKDKQIIVQAFEAGPAAPKLAGELPLADGLSQARDEGAVFVVNPVDNTTYFYMEGMNAPMTGYLNRGHTSRAARVIDRSMREVEPGLFSSRIKLPAPGKFDLAVMLNQPKIAHCFSADVQPNKAMAAQRNKPRVEFLIDQPLVTAGATTKARFRILQGGADQPKTGIADLRVRYFQAPASRPYEVAAVEVGEGVYEAPIELKQVGAYYLHVGSSSLGMPFGSQPYASLRAVQGQARTNP
ncbi:cytochrome D1 domain-containing protein [Pseudomonas sp. JS3066]|uniref:cytochrome D1 domain-containing protein n=1 Tax=Pseudomonas sp. JS3066 TaxID=3090665 RepID=UPI002E7BC94D|nr:cytochrome D1 domain-containing protein [Pseudomonas sp. JS3066]WVK92451.1 cytochrome D1 domain-containing protein [Pseudomonas sp. JS3066]